MSKHLIRSIVVVAALVGMIVVNGLANSLPLNGQTTGEVSDAFDIRFVPAGYVFSIWGLIYLALIAFTVNLVRPSVGARPWVDRVGLLFAASSVTNAAWLFAWHYERFVLSEVLMLCLLALLITIYLVLDVGRAGRSAGQRWLVEAPMQLYLGWITVATVANTSSTLQHVGWGGWGVSDEIWAALLLAVCVVLAVAIAVTRRDAIFNGVLAWASAGIAVAQADAPLVRTAAWIVCGIAVVLVVVSGIGRLRAAGGPRAGGAEAPAQASN